MIKKSIFEAMDEDYSNKNWKNDEILERLDQVTHSVETADDNLNCKIIFETFETKTKRAKYRKFYL